MTLADPSVPTGPVRGPSRVRRTAAAVAGTLGVVAVVGGGALAWQFWTAQGPQPAEALPGGTLAYLALDLDPPGGQKVAAYDALRKFPTLKKDLGLGSQDDLRRSLVKGFVEESDCDLSYDDVADWAGERFAVAVVAQDEPEPVVVVQVADAGKATAGLGDVVRACGGGDLGFVVTDGWALLARSEAVARRVVDDTARGTLEDDADYRRLTEAAGDPGVVAAYLAPEAGRALLEAVEANPFLAYTLPSVAQAADPLAGLMTSLAVFPLMTEAFSMDAGADVTGGAGYEPSPEELEIQERFEKFDDLTEAEQEQLIEDSNRVFEELMEAEGGPVGPMGDAEVVTDEEMLSEDEFPQPEVPADVRRALEDFTGLGGVARFDDGALEIEVIGDRLLGDDGGVSAGAAGQDAVASLPADSAGAMGGRLADGWADRFVDQVHGQLSFFLDSRAETLEAFEEATGLSVPADLEALGGDSIAVVAGPGVDFDVDRPSELPVAVRITGDADRIEAALEKLRKRMGEDVAEFLVSRRTSDGVVVGPSAAYLEALVDPDSRLGDQDRYRAAVPEADGARTVTYVDFDAGDWLVELAGDRHRADAAPFDTAGLTMTEEGDEQRILLRVTLD